MGLQGGVTLGVASAEHLHPDQSAMKYRLTDGSYLCIYLYTNGKQADAVAETPDEHTAR